MEDPIIVCPICGQQYLPAELYLPDDFLGKPTEIVRTTAGKVDFYFGTKMDPDTEYICDNCGAHLKVHANISFNVSTDDPNEGEHITYFNKFKKIQLEEKLFDD